MFSGRCDLKQQLQQGKVLKLLVLHGAAEKEEKISRRNKKNRHKEKKSQNQVRPTEKAQRQTTEV